MEISVLSEISTVLGMHHTYILYGYTVTSCHKTGSCSPDNKIVKVQKVVDLQIFLGTKLPKTTSAASITCTVWSTTTEH